MNCCFATRKPFAISQMAQVSGWSFSSSRVKAQASSVVKVLVGTSRCDVRWPGRAELPLGQAARQRRPYLDDASHNVQDIQPRTPIAIANRRFFGTPFRLKDNCRANPLTIQVAHLMSARE